METSGIVVSMVIPAYNEHEAIGPVLRDLIVVMDGLALGYEIIVVDDGSTDDTAAQSSRYDNVRVISHTQNRGTGAARTTGVRAALGKYIVMTDADGTYPAGAIPEMIRVLDEGAHMVIGAREREAGTVAWLRRPAKDFIRRLASYMVEYRIPDLNSGLRAMRKDLVERFYGILPNSHSWVSTITMAALSSGYMVRWIPIEYHERIGRSTFHPVRDTYNYLTLVIRTIMYFNPLRLFIPACGLLFLAGFIKLVVDLFRFQFTGHVPASTVIILLGAVQVAAIGLLADLIVKVSRLRN
ncbi:MAG: glycosyltransferase family 2 protein [Chloroflexi bacterium]|nr:glycosyltransferase family 2 protein [Chloroflexota bacterium]